MSIRIECPSCNTPNTVDEDDVGSKVRCRKCKEKFTVPAGKKSRDEDDEASVQEGRKVKSKPAARNQVDDDDQDADDRPAPKKKTAPKAKEPAGGMGMILVLGGVAAVFFVLAIGALGIGGYFWYRSKAAETEVLLAQAGDKKNDPNEEKKGKEENKKEEEKLEPKEDKKDPVDMKDPDEFKKKDPNPPAKKDPDIKKIPEPDPKTPKLDPLPSLLQRVRNATVHVRAMRPNGQWLEGSGFFVENQYVITNAHVLGMLEPGAPEPVRIEVTLYGGQANEQTIPAAGPTVDRANDLATLRFFIGNAPAPLAMEDPSKIAVTQRVQVVGYPFGREKRKDPTFSDTTVSQIKKNKANAVEEIEFNGGMSPGHSGGPVVTSEGKVVGVALGAVKDTNVHLAIPTDAVKRLLNGRMGEIVFGQANVGLKKTVFPADVPLIDPKQRIRTVRFESWTGNAAPAREYSYAEPKPMPGDGPHSVGPTIVKTPTSARGNISVPTVVPSGQVVWVQAIATLDDNSKQWSAAAILPIPKGDYDKKPINLTANLQNPKDRTLDLKYTLQMGDKGPLANNTSHLYILESMTPQAEGAIMRTGFGTIIFSGGPNAARFNAAREVTRSIPTTYALDATGKVAVNGRTYRAAPVNTPKDQRDAAIEHVVQIGIAHELTMMPFPNRQVQPGESWKVPASVVVMNKANKSDEIRFLLNCTYEGISKGAKAEAVIAVTANVRPTNREFAFFDSDLAGTIGVDPGGAFVSSARLKVTSIPDAAKQDRFALEIEASRVAGNTRNIQLPQEPKTTDPPKDPKIAKKVILDQKGILAANDPIDPSLSTPKQKAHYKMFQVPMQAGKTYHIEVKLGAAFDSLIKIQAPTGAFLGQEKHRTNFRAPANGVFRVYIVAANHRTGQFHLVVTENP